MKYRCKDVPSRGSDTCEKGWSQFGATFLMALAKRLTDEEEEAIRVHLVKDLVCTYEGVRVLIFSYMEQ